MKICVYGSASNLIDDEYKQRVYVLGKKLAERGHTLIFGAGANGLMGAAARGWTDGKGEIIGIVPHFFRDIKVEELYDKCTKVIWTDDMYQRKALLESESDAYIITPGGIGTFDEFFAVLTNKQLGQHVKQIAIYNVNGYYDRIKNLLDYAIKEKFVTPNCDKIYTVFGEDELDKMIEFIETKPSGEKLDNLKDG